MGGIFRSLREVFPGLEFVFDTIRTLDPDKLHLKLKRDLYVFLDNELGVVLILASFEVNKDFYKLCVRGDKENLLRACTYAVIYDVYKNSKYIGFMVILANPNIIKAVA